MDEKKAAVGTSDEPENFVVQKKRRGASGRPLPEPNNAEKDFNAPADPFMAAPLQTGPANDPF